MEDLSLTECIRQEKRGYYFESYSEIPSQEMLIRDRIRTLAYKRAIEMNPHLFEGKVVLDVGCGLGVLSLFAAKAGAKTVIGVDASDITFQAEKIVKANRFDKIIIIINAKIEDLVELPNGIKKVDIIVSEWMGLCLYHESMLATVIYARDRWLKEGGLIFPDKVRLYLGAVDDSEKNKRCEPLDNVGFNMEPLKELKYKEASSTIIKPSEVITNYCLLNKLDLNTATCNFSFTSDYTLIAKRNTRIFGFITYFDAIFSKCHKKIVLSTSPSEPLTHWGQTIFRFKDGVSVDAKNEITGKFTLKPFEYNFRDLSFQISVNTRSPNMIHNFTCSYVLR